MKRNVVALIRVSDDEQAQEGKTGLQRQIDDVERIVEANQLEVVRLFRLEGVSGPLVPESPEFQEMVDLMKRPDIAGLVVAKLDRLMRTENVSDLAVFKHFERPKRLIWTNSGSVLDITTFEGKILISQQCLFAGKEKADILERAHGGKQKNRAKADKCPDPLPRGAVFNRKNGQFAYTPEAERIKIACQKVLEGQSQRSIARELGYKHPRCLRIQLMNPIWIGIRESKYRRGERPSCGGRLKDGPKVLREEPIRAVTNLAENPLILPSVWNEVQKRLNRSQRTWQLERSRESAFELSGLLYCPCGKRFYSKSDRNGYYYCSSQHDGEGCGNRWFRREEVDGSAARAIREILTNPAKVRELVMSKKSADSEIQIRKRTADAEAEVERLEGEKVRLLKLVRSGIADPDDTDVQKQFIDIRASVAEQNALLHKAQVERESNRITDVAVLVRQIVKLFAKFETLGITERKGLLRKLVSRMSLGRDGQLNISLRLSNSHMDTRIGTRADNNCN